MHNKKSLFVVIALVVILVAGFFTYSQIYDKAKQDDNKKVTTNDKESPVTPKAEDKKSPVEKTPIPQSNPQKGETFVEGKVKSIDVEKRIITITQSMDDNSKPINPNVPIKKDAIIQDKKGDMAITQIKINDIVLMIITSEGQARSVQVNF